MFLKLMLTVMLAVIAYSMQPVYAADENNNGAAFRGGDAALFSELEAAFKETYTNTDANAALDPLFKRVKSLEQSDDCSNAAFKKLAALMVNPQTWAFQFDSDTNYYSGSYGQYNNAAYLAQLNQNPFPARERFKVTNGDGSKREAALSMMISPNCDHAFVRVGLLHSTTMRNIFSYKAYSEIKGDLASEYTVGRVMVRPYIMDTNKIYSGRLGTVSFICNNSQCFSGTVKEVFESNPKAIQSSEAWPEAVKHEWLALERERDARLALEQKARNEKEARENEQRRIMAVEAARVRAKDEQNLNTALNNKNPQVMYLAAGKYEREGRQYEARQVYERLIERFPSSSWAIKANDQLLQSQRVDSVTSSARNATSEANNRAYKACQIEMDSCYSRNGSNCYRDCKSLR